VAVLVPAGEPEFDPAQVVPLELDIIANLAKVRRKALFAIRGYPRGSGIDYESGIIARDSLAALGFYEGPAPWRACHTLSLSTENLGGPDGLSGSPVVRALRNPDGTWVPALAGMVQRGGPSKVHFVDARVLIGFLEGARLSEA